MVGSEAGATMIISYRHRFTFLHSPKSGGSSIKMLFAPRLGPRDILLGAREERETARVRPNLRARLDAASTLTASGVLAAIGLRSERKIVGRQHKAYVRHFGPSVDHPSAENLRAFDERAWDRHFKFSFVRNPYERTVSMYLFLTRGEDGRRPSMGHFLDRLLDGGCRHSRWLDLIDQWGIHAIGDRVAVDYVGRHERFADDFATICGAIGFPRETAPRAKAAKPYQFRDFYDGRSRRLIARMCERELDHFGYVF